MRKVWNELILYMKDARGRGYRTILRGEKLVVNGRSYELGHYDRRFQLKLADKHLTALNVPALKK
jgi:hypothetical protein